MDLCAHFICWDMLVYSCNTSFMLYMYKGGLKSLYDDVISAVDDFFINGIQELQHQWKNGVNHKEDYVEK